MVGYKWKLVSDHVHSFLEVVWHIVWSLSESYTCFEFWKYSAQNDYDEALVWADCDESIKWITTTEVVRISKHAGLPLARCMAITPSTLSRNSHWGHSWWAINSQWGHSWWAIMALFRHSLCASHRQHGIATASLRRGGDLQLPPQKKHVEVSLSPRYLEILKLGSTILHEYCVLHSRHMLTMHNNDRFQ